MIKASVLLKPLKHQLTDYNRFESGELKVVGKSEYPRSDCVVNNIMSYTEWVNSSNQYPIIKVEGIESIKQIVRTFNKFPVKNIHLFVSQKAGTSFKWHGDSLNVFLYVLKGQKIVHLRNRKILLNPGNGIIIDKGHLHKVFSKHNTWALSIGY